MMRARLAKVMLAASLGLSGGCTSLSNHSWFSGLGHRDILCGQSYDMGTTPYCEGGMMQDGGAYAVTPTTPGTCGPALNPQPMLTPQPMMPPLTAPPPRLEPRPAQPEPFRPTMREFN